jgi:hypothetical protein
MKGEVHIYHTDACKEWYRKYPTIFTRRARNALLEKAAEAAQNYVDSHTEHQCEFRVVNGYCVHKKKLHAALDALKEGT